MTTKFAMGRDINGYNAFITPPCDDLISGTLAEDTEQNITVPSASPRYNAIFSYELGGNVWVSINDTAVVGSDALSATTSEQNPVGKQVKAGDTISFITSDTSVNVGVAFYAL